MRYYDGFIVVTEDIKMECACITVYSVYVAELSASEHLFEINAIKNCFFNNNVFVLSNYINYFNSRLLILSLYINSS